MLETISLLPPKKELQQSVNDFWHCIMANQEGFVATFTHNRTIACLSSHKCLRTHCYCVLKMSVNGELMTSGLASRNLKGLNDYIDT